MELVKFTDDTYQSLSNDTIITSSCDKRKWCALKENVLTAQQGSVSGESSGRASL